MARPITDERENEAVSGMLLRVSEATEMAQTGTTRPTFAAGYGLYADNDTFMMHPFCWCERDDCDWCRGDISPQIIRAAYHDVGHALADDRTGPAANFHHKPSGMKVWWYRAIGHDMEVEGPTDKDTLDRIEGECIASLEEVPIAVTA